MPSPFPSQLSVKRKGGSDWLCPTPLCPGENSTCARPQHAHWRESQSGNRKVKQLRGTKSPQLLSTQSWKTKTGEIVLKIVSLRNKIQKRKKKLLGYKYAGNTAMWNAAICRKESWEVMHHHDHGYVTGTNTSEWPCCRHLPVLHAFYDLSLVVIKLKNKTLKNKQTYRKLC